MIKNGSFKCHLVPRSEAAKKPLRQSHSGWCDMVPGNVKFVVSPSGRGGLGFKSRQPDHLGCFEKSVEQPGNLPGIEAYTPTAPDNNLPCHRPIPSTRSLSLAERYGAALVSLLTRERIVYKGVTVCRVKREPLLETAPSAARIPPSKIWGRIKLARCCSLRR